MIRTSKALPVEDSSQLNVLVADDVPVNLRIAAAMLKRMGHRGVLVQDGGQALRAIASQHFDAVLLDVSMPVLDGLSVLKEIRSMDESCGRRTPVIIVSGHAFAEDRQRFLSAGADGFVAKPVDFEILRSEMMRAVGSMA